MKLLLDYDGVVLKSRSLSDYQLRKSAMFVEKHTKLPFDKCQKMNKKYYPRYGHTVTMLNCLFKKPVTLEQYNDYMFNKKDLHELSWLVFPHTKQHAQSFIDLFNVCDNCNIDWYIFTNAHVDWVMHFARICELPIDEKKVIWPSTLDLLKPKAQSYDNIEKRFPDETLIFIDDSDVNLVIPQQRSQWIPIKYN